MAAGRAGGGATAGGGANSRGTGDRRGTVATVRGARQLQDQIVSARDQAVAWLQGELDAARTQLRQEVERGRVLVAAAAEREQTIARVTADAKSHHLRIESLERDLSERAQHRVRPPRGPRCRTVRGAHYDGYCATPGELAQGRADAPTPRGVLREREEGIVWLQGELAEARRRGSACRSSTIRCPANFTRSWLREAGGGSRATGAQARITGRRVRRAPLAPERTPASVDDGQGERTATDRRRTAGPAALAPPPAPPPDAVDSLTLLPVLQQEDAIRILGRGIPDESRRRIDVVCFSIIDWEFRYQRPQQIMSQFAEHGHRVFYISTSRFRSGSAGTEPGVRLIKENVYEVQLAAARTPNVYGEIIGSDDRTILDSLAELRRAYDISSAVAYVMIASWTEVALEAGRRWSWPVVYDCMDEWENFQGIDPALVAAETGLVRRCDLLVVSAARLEQKWRPYGRPMVLARNGVDYEFYSARCRPNALLADAAHPIIGYFGAIADWFDVDLACASLASDRSTPSCCSAASSVSTSTG